MEKLYEIIKESLIKEYDAIPPKDELEKLYKFSEKHEKKMQEIFNRIGIDDKKENRHGV